MKLAGNRTYLAVAAFVVGAVVKKLGIPGVDSADTLELVGFVADGLQAVGATPAVYFRSQAQPVDKQSDPPAGPGDPQFLPGSHGVPAGPVPLALH